MANVEGQSYWGVGLDHQQFAADAAKIKADFRGIGDSAVAESSRMDTAYRKLGTAVAAAFTAQKAFEFGKAIVQVTGNIESLEISFRTLLGNKEKADALFSDIRRYATLTPLGLGDLAKGAQMLLSFNVEAERVMPILKQLGDISMGDAQKLNQLTLAFSQMMSTGKLMGQDLLQMINAGFNPLTVISEKTGKSIGQLKKEMEGGAISSEMVADAFAAATAEGGKFHGMLDKQSKGIKGSISNLQGSIEDMLNDIGSANQGLITGSIQGATKVVEHYKEIGEAIAVLVGLYGMYRAALITTAAIRGATQTVQHTEEAASLYQLLSAEQQATISKKGLSTTSAEYYALVKAETAANVQAAQGALLKARTEVKAASEAVTAKRTEYVAAKQLEQQRLAELMSIGATGSAKQVEAATRKLASAETQRETAATAFQTATRDFHTKRLAVETAARTANTVATTANTASQTANATATGFLTLVKTRLTVVAARLNAVIMANPFALAATAALALRYGLYKLITYQTDSEKAQAKLNDAISESDRVIGSEIHQIDAMFGRLKAAKQGTDEWRAARDAIMSRYGEHLRKLGDEKTALNDIAAAYALITEEAKRAARARAMESFSKDAADTLAEKEGDANDEVRKLLDKKFKGQKGADGVSLSETYYWKIKPVIEGKSEITDEVETIIKEFDKTKNVMVGITANETPIYKETVTNAIREQIASATRARGVYNQTMSAAQMKFGENPNAGGGGGADVFDTTTASLGVLMTRLPEARAALEALKTAAEPDPAAIAAKEQEIAQIVAATAAREKGLSVIKDVKAQIELLQKEQEKYSKDDPEYAALGTRIKSLQKRLPLTTGQSNKEETDAARIAREKTETEQATKDYYDAVTKEITHGELERQQTKIDLIKEGYDKEQKQNELNYDRMLFENRQREAAMVKALQDIRERQWETENPEAKKSGQTFDRSTVTAADLSPEQQASIAEFYRVAEEIRNKANKDSLDKMLAEVKTYEQRRNDITEEYARKRASMQNEDGTPKAGFTQGNINELNRNEKTDLEAIDSEFAKREQSFQAWMDAIANMTLKQLERVLLQAEEALESAKASGVSDTQLAAARAKVTAAREQVAKTKAQNEVSPGKRSIKEWEDLYKVLNEAKDEFENIGDTVGGVAGEIISTAGSVMTSSLSMINGLMQFSTMANSTITGTATTTQIAIQTVEKASVILTIISAALQIAMAIVNLFNKDKKREKEIQRIQGQIDALQKSYDKLGRAIEKAYAVDASNLIQQQDEFLRQQRVLIEQQIAAEKNKKKTDWDRISDWEDAIADIDAQLEETKDRQIEAIIGSDIQSAIDEFAEAYVDAWSAGEDRAKAMKDVVRSMVKSAVTELVKSRMSPEVQNFMSFLAKAMEDGVLTAAEQRALDEFERRIYAKAESIDREFGKYIIDEDAASDREGSSRGFESMTQDSADELNGRFTAFQATSHETLQETRAMSPYVKATAAHTESIRATMNFLREVTGQVLDHLAGIRANTGHLETIKDEIKTLNDSIDDISTQGVIIRRS